ncbi:hypothetical protein ACOSQ2_012805 [Xanthoceras sorbifolium]
MDSVVREGASHTKPPLLNDTNYSFWKVRMRAYLKSIDEHVWISIEEGYTPPTTTSEDGIRTLKPKSTWTPTDYNPCPKDFKLKSQLLKKTRMLIP